LIQSIVANNGDFNGTRFFSEKTGARIFETQAHDVDLVLGIEVNFGMGYGLASSVTPLGPEVASGPGSVHCPHRPRPRHHDCLYAEQDAVRPRQHPRANIARAAVEAALR